MSEAPFRPREKLFEKQKYFQNIPKHTYLKGPMDKVTSVAIPLALAATSLYLIVSLIVMWSFYLSLLFLLSVCLQFSICFESYYIDTVLCIVSRDEGSITCRMELERKNDLGILN